MSNGWNTFVTDFRFVFIQDDRWKSLFQGLGNTLVITFFAVMIGIVLGAIVATVRTTYDKNNGDMKKRNPVGFYILSIANVICKLYLTVIRGTPVVVQLLIMYFVIFGSSRIDKVPVAILAFGINSGAYVAEIFRSGIQSVDKGQMEAARSLGMPYWRAMRRVVLPQAIRTMIPSIINQFIITLKDTSILSVIGFPELVNTAKNVVAITYKSAQVWFIEGVMYLVIITILSRVAKLVERRLNRGR